MPFTVFIALAGAAITRLATNNPADPIPANTCRPRMFPTQSLRAFAPKRPVCTSHTRLDATPTRLVET